MNLQIALLQKNKIPREIGTHGNGTIKEYISVQNLKQSSFQYRLFDVILIDNLALDEDIISYLLVYYQNHPESGLAIINANYSVSNLPTKLRRQLVFFSTKPLDRASYCQILKKGNHFKQRNLQQLHTSILPVNGDNVQLFGISREIRNINDFIKFIGRSAYTPCLIYGEEGTEKIEVVKMIHSHDKNEYSQLRQVKCADYSEEELMEKLFGVEHSKDNHERNKRGEIEIAEDGSLVLENIEKLPEKVQLPLLAYIETHRFRRMGSDHDFIVKTRIVASTHTNLEKLVNHGKFSRELYYHLTAFEITIPPLRQRKKDIIYIAKHFIRLSNQKYGHQVTGLSPEVELKFLEYNWYGNIEELRLIIERIVLLKTNGNITIGDLPSDILENKTPKIESEVLGNCSLRDLEKIHIEKTMLRTKGNKSRAADILNISRTTLREKLRSFELVH